MNKFSERIGVTSIPTLQIDGVNNDLKNSIWNQLYSLYEGLPEQWIPLSELVARFFRKVPVDELPDHNYQCKDWFKKYFYSLAWYDIYNIIEFLLYSHKRINKYSTIKESTLIESWNYIFEREISGYRFVSGLITPISNSSEIREIENAINSSEEYGIMGPSHHLQTALKLLGQKPNADYRNSIKESISAVESISKILSKKSKCSLSDALTELTKIIKIHPALIKGFKNIYGFTSDENGIRHALLEESNLDFDDAKYMLVSCSAFVNYLLSKANKGGLIK